MVVVLNVTFTRWLSPCKILKISNGSFHFYCWSKNSLTWLDERHNKPHKCYFHYLHVKIHTKITWFFPQILMIKEFCNLIGWKIQPAHLSKRDSLIWSPWWLFSCRKSNRLVDSLKIYWWSNIPAIWLNERHNWPHWKLLVSDAAFPWWLTPCKKLGYHLIHSRDIDDQRILQSDWTKGTTGHTHLKELALDAVFHC